ncbi:LCP family protein [Bifidobacterium sp.]|uniref:LCP family protein n=1 Tax=Bifidobacterium sp. TaxID=41200 RepID=UPI0025BEFC7B|nr:LCP family protein [Bifidobacterium sp.]MCI1635893.1 LCP family protein [Bifidobacterium sp.]
MVQESSDSETWDNPPSFMPSHGTGHPAMHRPKADDTSSVPPSFSPRSSSQAASRQSASPSSPRAQRTAASSRNTGNTRNAGNSQNNAHSRGANDGSRQPASSSSPRKATARSNASPSTRKPLAHQPSQSPSTKGKRKKKRSAGRIVLRILIVLIVLFTLLGVGLWSWVNGQLNKKDMLSDAANTSASTWLILGSDERDGTAGTGTQADAPGSRTDTILVLTKPKSGPSSLISIPRDSFVNTHNTNMKINAVAELYGYKALVEQVETITGQKIDHVAMIKFGGLEKVVDALGGIELCYDSTVQDAYSGLNWTAGCHTADGATALAFSRMRYSDPQGDFGRAKRQRQVIAAIVSKASKASTLTNFSSTKQLATSALSAIVVDNDTNPWTLLQMALAFKSASGESGVTGSAYWTNPDYYPGGGVGSTVKLDADRNLALFTQLATGVHAAGTVGGQD